MTTVILNLKDRNTKKESSREVNFLRESWIKNPHREIEDWIRGRGNPQHSTPTQPADLELVSHFVKKF